MTDDDKLVKALRCKRDDCEGCDLAFFDKDEGWMCQYAAKDDDAADAIEELQAEVAELKRVNMEIFEDLPKLGEWIDGDGRRVTARCSVCGHLRLGNGAEYANKYVHFCENCGSKMGGQNDEP